MYNGLSHNPPTHTTCTITSVSSLVLLIALSPSVQYCSTTSELGYSVQHVGFVQCVHNIVYILYASCIYVVYTMYAYAWWV